ncbi:hypothetical protein [Sedimenticola selenatireducens]|uniref:Uncharacterized protein n=1 Tax=Sedimenticola selenatireducens TaxID=191960 RepID=A0A2N6CVC0_9GAMM|nr:hypothetical protein [Sedimenticola selenatireducens]PLX61148.1 MAG: hypothetical protein C0630_12170 [Sedimenticola selenatireducens]
MKKQKNTIDESVREALDNLYKGTEVEQAMTQAEKSRRAKRNRNMLASFLTGRLNPEFLRLNTHVTNLHGCTDQNNEKAVIRWAHRKIEDNPEQLEKLTAEFMVECYEELTEILLENQY